MALRVLDVSVNEPDGASIFLPHMASIMKENEKEKEQNYEYAELKVCTDEYIIL